MPKDYPFNDKLEELCRSFVGKKFKTVMEFNGKTISIVNPDIVGNALEELFFPFYCEVCPDFKQGPPQNPPDFYALDNEFQFEQKCFGKSRKCYNHSRYYTSISS